MQEPCEDISDLLLEWWLATSDDCDVELADEQTYETL
jgi:hypothetical protein